MEAFNQLLTSVKDPLTGSFVPDTTGLVRLMETQYANETPEIIKSLNSAPSAKYQGYTRLQEFVRDGFDLSNQGMRDLDHFLNNHGTMPIPRYVPDGIE